MLTGSAGGDGFFEIKHATFASRVLELPPTRFQSRQSRPCIPKAIDPGSTKPHPFNHGLDHLARATTQTASRVPSVCDISLSREPAVSMLVRSKSYCSASRLRAGCIVAALLQIFLGSALAVYLVYELLQARKIVGFLLVYACLLVAFSSVGLHGFFRVRSLKLANPFSASISTWSASRSSAS